MMIWGWALAATAGMLPMSWEGELNGSGGHQVSGRAVLSDGPYGAILALKQLRIDAVPDARVYLALGGDYRKGIELGRLDAAAGEVSFKIPVGVDPAAFDSVVIWDATLAEEVGHAPLAETGM